MIEAGYFAEVQAAITMQQMGRATPGAPGIGACRRDLKPEEFLFQTKKAGGENIPKVTGPGLLHPRARAGPHDEGDRRLAHHSAGPRGEENPFEGALALQRLDAPAS